MRCNICNSILNDTEIKFDTRYETFDPCGRCLMEISEVFNDHPEEDEIVIGEEDFDDELMGLIENSS